MRVTKSNCEEKRGDHKYMAQDGKERKSANAIISAVDRSLNCFKVTLKVHPPVAAHLHYNTCCLVLIVCCYDMTQNTAMADQIRKT